MPTLANLLQTTPALLYERQRALVRAGLLTANKGRGPGSGVACTPQSVAMLLIGLMASDDLKDVEKRTREIAGAKLLATKCPIPNAGRFDHALAWCLSSKENAEKIDGVDVSRRSIFATIAIPEGEQIKAYMFVGKSGGYGSFRVLATIDAPIIRKIAHDLAIELPAPVGHRQQRKPK